MQQSDLPATPRRFGFLRTRRGKVITTAAVFAALVGGGLVVAPFASADEIGQAPSAQNITGAGNFRTTETRISGQSGFGGGFVYTPNATGRFPVISVSPGFTARWSSIDWMGPRLASWGFVVVGIETNSTTDQPASRGRQLLAALDWAVNDAPSAVRAKVDGSRRGVAGHSMGGGGTLEALKADTTGTVRAGVPVAPWDLDKTWDDVSEAVMIVGGQRDAIAPVSTHSNRFFNTLAGPKALVEIAGGSHFFPQQRNEPTTSRAMVSWFKSRLSDDGRFDEFTCGFNAAAGASRFQSNQC
ncbi:lipase [Virgisporangium aliadipatigenens]|uniref:Lipase n=1 Tax=Virgisporangium aliadipatigenens TaxID=741659 RepID=A0A8J4DQ11_9ACTN|nr:alpha/beta hydrolase [Virgisporangium aliadipatigenens]GIJ44952.1 lipase [Virgisporangium aliadipatigenens]